MSRLPFSWQQQIGRLTGKTGVCMATLVPGANNISSRIREAYRFAEDKSINKAVDIIIQMGKGVINERHPRFQRSSFRQ